MKAPLSWIYEYCDAGIDGKALAERLALTGTEVERVHTHGVPSAENFIVGRVVNTERHPDADRLKVCEVAVGNGSNVQIVCGASNVAEGQTVAVARPGAVLPNGLKLKQARLRGVDSNGMILSEQELEIGTGSEGIMVLPDDIAPGTPLAAVLPISTEVLELEITPNRPDCLGIYGVAREVHATTGKPLASPPWSDDPGSSGVINGVSINVEAQDLCPRFTARLFSSVTVADSPRWLKARLMAVGQRPINNVVDITNYVMLLTGQPLHAFDADQIAGSSLTVRRAKEGEVLTTLDGVERSLDPSICVISDESGVTSIAGVIGGERSEVSEATTEVLMEAACWNGPNIQRASTKLGVRTEASARFEKQLSPGQTTEAQALAATLMVELCGAKIVPGTIDIGAQDQASKTIQLRLSTVKRLLSVEVDAQECKTILQRLGFEVQTSGSDASSSFDVTVPHFRRFDIKREVDLVEEIVRIWGLEKIPATLPSKRTAFGALTRRQLLRRRVEDTLTATGMFEIVGWSFTAPDVADRLALPADDVRRRNIVRLKNPMSEEQSVMRFTLLDSLLDVARYNRARGAESIALFEYGTVFLGNGEGSDKTVQVQVSKDFSATEDESKLANKRQTADNQLPGQRPKLAGILSGLQRDVSWGDTSPGEFDFFSAKARVSLLLDALRINWSVVPNSQPFLHPGRSADVIVDGLVVGWLGEIHPSVCSRWDLGVTVAFELDFNQISDAVTSESLYSDLSSYPPVREDLAIVFSNDILADQVVEVIRRVGRPLVKSVEIFDVYRSEQLGEGYYSLALRLQFGANDRTLTDDEVHKRRKKIIEALASELGGVLRAGG